VRLIKLLLEKSKYATSAFEYLYNISLI